MIVLSEKQILMLHTHLIQRTGGTDGIRDKGLLEQADRCTCHAGISGVEPDRTEVYTERTFRYDSGSCCRRKRIRRSVSVDSGAQDLKVGESLLNGWSTNP